MKPAAGLTFWLAMSALAAGCGLPDPPCDPPVAASSIFVVVRDSLTARPLAKGTAGTADASGVHDTLVTIGDDSTTLYAAHNVPGVYRVTLRHEGYRDWVRDGIAVEWGRCGGGNVLVAARLQPLAP